MHSTITDQARIGWGRFACGFISNYWKPLLASWRGNKYPPTAQQLVKLIWQAGYKLWDERNDWVYDDNQIKQSHKIGEINEMISKEYEFGGIDLPDLERNMLLTPKIEILSSARSVKKNWLGRIFAARARVRRRRGVLAGEEVEDSYKEERKFIQNWRTNGVGRNEKIKKTTGKEKIRKRIREKGEVNLRVQKRRKQILYKKLMKK